MIKKTLITLSILTFALVLLIGVFISKPEIFVGEAAIKNLAPFLLSEDASLSWDNLKLETEIKDGGDRLLLWRATNFCLQEPDLGIEQACFKQIDIKINFTSFFFVPSNLAIEKAHLFGGRVIYKPRDPPDQNEEEKIYTKTQFAKVNKTLRSSLQKIAPFLRGKIHLEVDSILIKPSSSKQSASSIELRLQLELESLTKTNLDGSLLVQLKPEKKASPSPSTTLRIRLEGEQKVYQIRSALVMKSLTGRISNVFLDKTITEKNTLFEALALSVDFHDKSERLKFDAQAKLKEKKLALLFQSIEAVTKKGGNTLKANSPLCELILNPSQLYSALRLSCQKITIVGATKAKLKKGRPRSFQASGFLNISLTNIQVDGADLSATIDLDSKLKMKEKLAIKITATQQIGLKDEHVTLPKLKASILVKDITDLYPFLKPHNLVPPAPFYALNGEARINLESQQDQQKVGFEVRINTRSTNQVLKVSSKGSYDLKARQLIGEIVLDDVKIVAPKISFLKDTPLIPNTNIKTSKKDYENKTKVINKRLSKELESKSKQASFNYSLKLRTKKPLLLSNEVTQTPVPLTINLLLEREVSGEVSIVDYSLSLFQRKALLKYVKIKTTGKPKDPGSLESLILVTHGQYTITIKVVGPVNKPTVLMESTPALSREDIISVLLYGYPLEEGNFDNASNVANTSSALSDKAFGLASLFLFASTPIESVRYNSETQSVKASMRLGKSTLVSVGSKDVNNRRNYGIKKRLGKNVYIDTELINDTIANESYLVGMFKWIFRY